MEASRRVELGSYYSELFRDEHFGPAEHSRYRERVEALERDGWKLVSLAPVRLGAIGLFVRVRPSPPRLRLVT